MIRIAIVDDNNDFLSSYKKIVGKIFTDNDIEHEICCYTDSVEFKECTSYLNFDLIFLDIDMPKITGLDIAMHLGKIESEAAIIFVSSHSHLVFQSIHYRPFRFLQKDNLLEQTREAIESFCRLIKEDENSISLKLEDGRQSIEKLSKIQFFYSLRHSIFFAYSGQKESIRLYNRAYSLDRLEKELHDKGFIRIHKSYLVNFRYIYSIQEESIILRDKSEIPMSRRKSSEIKEQYQICLRKGVWK